ncbi:hypothetical protein L226DRAFT_608643 [Lentinus tigrinus ALCF2SS1-7]|uniref:WSC domain-containing protein n=1 Tax=Lentinus tigrinus ALCF2SS1-6 TaxID=1328759 RepID=A0A5C2SU54_9APHY|nr:hypothetical protein L227DRAFT_648528 [Lentinus tigrinus ALCF2SS1-6]RPD81412.1 hypothetical protein L226DRAFT_608643 [Lentinus tigrinus ALCF2SS1-7]
MFNSFLLTIIIVAIIRGVLSQFVPPWIPLGWWEPFPCAVDFPSRIFRNVNTTVSSTLTVPGCIELCDASGYNIRYAGVENGNECHCGTDLAAAPNASDVSECDMPCSGDFVTSCGGPWRIQIYQSPELPGNPNTSWVVGGCYVDTPDTPAFDRPIITQTFSPDTDVVDQCNMFCQHRGIRFAGVALNGTQCQCSATGLNFSANVVPYEECEQALCPTLYPGALQLCGGPQRLWVHQYSDFNPY